MSQVALRHGRNGARDLCGRAKQVFDQRVDRNFHLAPGASGLVKPGALSSLAFLANHVADAFQFLGHVLIGGNNLVKGVGHFSRQSYPSTGKPHGEVAIAHALQAG